MRSAVVGASGVFVLVDRERSRFVRERHGSPRFDRHGATGAVGNLESDRDARRSLPALVITQSAALDAELFSGRNRVDSKYFSPFAKEL